MPKKSGNWLAIGRRKSSVARVQMTSGKGVFTMEFDHYYDLPEHLKSKIVEESQRAREGATKDKS